MSEHVGERVRLDWTGLEVETQPTRMKRPTELLDRVDSFRWRVSRAYPFKNPARVNVQEARTIRAAICEAACEETLPERRVNLTNSRVCVGPSPKTGAAAF